MSRALVGPVAALALVLLPGLAGAQSQVEGELNRAKAAMQLKKYDEAAARFEKLARAGNPAAQFYMGRLTAMGLGVAQDLPKAVDWFQLAATQGGSWKSVEHIRHAYRARAFRENGDKSFARTEWNAANGAAARKTDALKWLAQIASEWTK